MNRVSNGIEYILVSIQSHRAPHVSGVRTRLTLETHSPPLRQGRVSQWLYREQFCP